MRSVLPLKVLGLAAPVLCWVEGAQRSGLPETWRDRGVDFEERIRNWLKQELPTYSFDNLDEVISLAGDRRINYFFPLTPRRGNDLATLNIMPKGFDLTCMISQLAYRYFQWAGNELCIRENRIVELHEFAIRFPVRHLIHYCHAEAVGRGYISMDEAFELPTQMSQLPTTYQSLRTVVDKGLSDGHIHLNGVINADEAWSDHLLRRLTPRSLKNFPAERRRLLVLGRNTLRLLAVGLLYNALNEKNLPFQLIDGLDKIYHAQNPLTSRTLKEEFETRFREETEELQKAYRTKLPWAQQERWKWLLPLIVSDVYFNPVRCDHHDPLYEIFDEHSARLRMIYLRKLHLNICRALLHNKNRPAVAPVNRTGDTEYTDTFSHQPTPARGFLHQLAYRYTIYNTHHWQEATQSGKTTGLRNFQCYFDSPQRELLSGNRLDIYGVAIERLSMAKPLRVVEGRLSPPSGGAARYLPWVLAFAQQVDENQLDKFGIVVHFKKDDYQRVQWKTCEPGTHFLRHGKIRRFTRTDALKLYRLMSTPHPVVPFIVGIDAANLELTTPPEVFAPSFRFLREYPVRIHRRYSTKEQYGEIEAIDQLVKKRRLGLTYHVGEDFRHLLSGLRAIHEVIEFLKPLPGDRLGHAIALALKPEIWAAQVGYQAVLPQQEWLDTLVWLHYLLGAGHDLLGELAIEDKIQRYSRKIYGKAIYTDSRDGRTCRNEREWAPITLQDSWRLRQLDPYSIETWKRGESKFSIRQRGSSPEQQRWTDIQKKVLNEVDSHVGTDAAYDLVKLYWFDSGVHDRGKEIITIEMKDDIGTWLEVFTQAQKKIQDMVRDKQLVVEVNPTSNRLIGPMESMADHPIFQLTLDQKHQMEKQIRVTINTDDPGVFATSLPHEYYLMGESLLARGKPEPEVVEWLEWLRQNGEEYSFLNRLADAGDKHMQKLLAHLRTKYHRLLHRLKGKKRLYRPPGSHGRRNCDEVRDLEQLKAKIEEIERRKNESERELETLKEQISGLMRSNR